MPPASAPAADFWIVPVNMNKHSITLAVDALGGDTGMDVMVPACLLALSQDPDLNIRLFGDQQRMERLLGCAPGSITDRISFAHTSKSIGMAEKPVAALRRGQDSSIWLALESVRDQQADACVSAGNTGALMVLARKLIGTLQDIDRPALMAWLPSESGHTYLLDLGANVGVRATHLVQFAIMGSVTAQAVDGIEQPRVGLINVGREDSKGHEVLREAAATLEKLPINYVGFVEGNDIYQGEVNVAVCDGLIGNAILKSSEGLARMLFGALQAELGSDWRGKLTGLLGRRSFQSLLDRFDPGSHNGAALLGLKQIVVKSHGSADIDATAKAISTAALETRRHVPGTIEKMMQEYAAGAAQ